METPEAHGTGPTYKDVSMTPDNYTADKFKKSDSSNSKLKDVISHVKKPPLFQWLNTTWAIPSYGLTDIHSKFSQASLKFLFETLKPPCSKIYENHKSVSNNMKPKHFPLFDVMRH